MGSWKLLRQSFTGGFRFSCSRDAESTTAEVAVIRGEEFLDILDFIPEDCSNDGTVAGWLTPEQVLYFLNKVNEWR